MDAARAVAGGTAVGGLGPSEIPNAVACPMCRIAAYGFDLAAELLAAQKDFAVTLATTLTPGKPREP